MDATWLDRYNWKHDRLAPSFVRRLFIFALCHSCLSTIHVGKYNAGSVIMIAPTTANPLSPRAITLTLFAILRTSILLTAFSCGIHMFIRHGILRTCKWGTDMAKTICQAGNVMRLLHSCGTLTSGQASNCMAPDTWMVATGVITESIINVALPLNVSIIILLLFVCLPICILQRYQYFGSRRSCPTMMMPPKEADESNTKKYKLIMPLGQSDSTTGSALTHDQLKALDHDQSTTSQWVKSIKNAIATVGKTAMSTARSSHITNQSQSHTASLTNLHQTTTQHSQVLSNYDVSFLSDSQAIGNRQDCSTSNINRSEKGPCYPSGMFMENANHTFNIDGNTRPINHISNSSLDIVIEEDYEDDQTMEYHATSILSSNDNSSMYDVLDQSSTDISLVRTNDSSTVSSCESSYVTIPATQRH
ncbi:hypothetical protein BDF19DRAFT_466820 [Syncephalis fuscata]|nr:hypothetical protein BDF19DRAFT_466820 [Syncephalis fuscata]